VQANVLVNVVGKSASGFLHTRQVGKVFAPAGSGAEMPVIDETSAGEAAADLLAGFYQKVK